MLILIQLILICKTAMLSQLPLREALAHLTAEGLVQTIDHRGYQVATASAAVSGPSSPRQKVPAEHKAIFEAAMARNKKPLNKNKRPNCLSILVVGATGFEPVTYAL
jgi:hypothetical protein